MAEISDQAIGNIHTGMGDVAQRSRKRHRRLGHAIARGEVVPVGIRQSVLFAP